MGEKIKLSFVNDGKPFNLPAMTVKRQEELMEEMAKLEDKISEDQYNREINKILVLKTLQAVDDNITMEHINNMHPDDYIKLFSRIWTEGRELSDGDDSDFQIKK
jgi:hypothetical protein